MSRSQLGHQLYQLLPAVYRARDPLNLGGEVPSAPAHEAQTNDTLAPQGQLESLLDAYGAVLDQFERTLEQRYYDNFPDQDPRVDLYRRERNCQPWLLPYFAQLLDVNLVSANPEGQRDEVTHAIAWRQRKGTRVVAERIAEAVGRREVVVQEGWQRVATTARVGDPLLPEYHFGAKAPIRSGASPSEMARHPGLPSVTPDIRYAGGSPTAPGHHQDQSKRTVDVRTPDATRGHFHPRRVLLFAAPPEGLFTEKPYSVHWNQLTDPAASDECEHLFEVLHYRERHGDQTLECIHYRGLTDTPLKVRGVMNLNEHRLYRFENLWLDNRLTIHQGYAELIDCAARHLHLVTAELTQPVIQARACLFNRVEAPRGQVQLEYCTVLERLLAEHLTLSDAILMKPPRKDRVDQDVPAQGCIRFSRLPNLPDSQWLADGQPSQLQRSRRSCTHRQPLFINTHFGSPGCGVLDWRCAPEIQSGAEDGGEMGAYHDARHHLAWQAMQEKLVNYLPLGQEAALIPDPTLADCRTHINRD